MDKNSSFFNPNIGLAGRGLFPCRNEEKCNFSCRNTPPDAQNLVFTGFGLAERGSASGLLFFLGLMVPRLETIVAEIPFVKTDPPADRLQTAPRNQRRLKLTPLSVPFHRVGVYVCPMTRVAISERRLIIRIHD